MAPPNPDDGPPVSINEMWAVLTNREKNLVGRSLISTRNFDIENFFPSAVRLVYDSNQSRDTVQPVELDTQEKKGPNTTPDTTQHENITAKNAKLQAEPSRTGGTSGTALPRSEDRVVEDTKLPSDLALLAATSKTADAPDALKCGSGEAGSHKPMTTAALVSDLKPHTSFQSSASNGVDTSNVLGSNLVSKTSPAPKPAPLGVSNDSGVFGSRAPPKPLPEKDNVKSIFSFSTNLASTSPAPPPTEVIKKDPGFSFGNTPVSCSNASEATATNGLFGSNPTKVVPPATSTSSLSTGLFGASSPTAQTNPAGSSAPTSIEAFGSVATSGGLGFNESNKNPFRGGTSSRATGFGSGVSGQAKPAVSGLFGTTRPSSGGSLFSQDSAASSTSQALPESSSQGGISFGESNKSPFGGGTSSKSTGLSGPAKPAGSGFFGATSTSASGSLFAQGSAACSNSHAPTESASQSFFSFSKPLPGEEGADRSTKSVQAGGLFGNSSSNVASSSHDTSLGTSNTVPTTLFPAHDNASNTNSGCSDGGPNVSVFGGQKRKNDDVEGYEETAKKIRTTGSPLPHNGGSMFGGGFGFGWNTSQAKPGGMSSQVSAPTGQASTEALSSTDTTCQQITGPSSSSAHDSIPLKSPIATTSQTQANTAFASPFLKEAAGKIEPFSGNDPFIRPSSAKTVAGNVQAGTEEDSTSTETKGDIATTTENPFLNIRPTVLFDTVKPTVGLPADPKDIPPDSTQDHFVPYRERETNGEFIDFQSNHFMGELKKFSVEEARLADYNRGQRFGSFPNLLEVVPYEAPKEEPPQTFLCKSENQSLSGYPLGMVTMYIGLTKQ